MSRSRVTSRALTDAERLRQIIMFHQHDLGKVQSSIYQDLLARKQEDEHARGLLDVYITSNIKNTVEIHAFGNYYDKLKIQRNTSAKASDIKFRALKCNRCGRPNKDFDDAVKHHTECFGTCPHHCGAKIELTREEDLALIQNKTKKDADKIALQLHEKECIMICHSSYTAIAGGSGIIESVKCNSSLVDAEGLHAHYQTFDHS